MYTLGYYITPITDAAAAALLLIFSVRVYMMGNTAKILHELKTDPKWKGWYSFRAMPCRYHDNTAKPPSCRG